MSTSGSPPDNAPDRLRQDALDYHEFPVPGKLSVTATKSISNQRDLALAYSPGVAAACEAIAADPRAAHRFTARGNLVAVISNGTAVLGLGAIGPLAAKPVMEGKAVLFKKFAGIDVFDLEIDERDPQRLVEIIAALEPTFGGINLEDIKAPECFAVERGLRERMKIPVFHDDQHGTAVTVAAAIQNGLRLVGKDIGGVKLVVSGAGAAALACVDLLVELGLRHEQIWLTDLAGVVYEGRAELMDPEKARYARPTRERSLAEVIVAADIFLGLSAGGVLKPPMVARMAARPLILALANPTPEILPEEVAAVRADAIVATGRSDYPNQVNNVLCFPYIFRGALDAGATRITRPMKIAAVHAIAELARQEQSDVVAGAYGIDDLKFGPRYLIPKPFDPRLIVKIAPAVARAAMESGVATRPIADFGAYAQQLQQFVYHSGTFMQPVFAAARKVDPARSCIVFAEGERERVLRAAQVLVDEGLARPVLVGRPEVIEERVHAFGLRLRRDGDFTIVDPQAEATTLVAARLLKNHGADGMICGTIGATTHHLGYIERVIGLAPGASVFAGMSVLMLPGRQLFIVDTHINQDPDAEALAEITLMAAEGARRFGVEPKVALVSHSDFGSSDAPSARKLRKALALVRERAPQLEIDGEMHGDSALNEAVRRASSPETTLSGSANLLVLPNLDAASIAYNLLKTAAGNNVAIGPVLLGCAAPVHILTPAVTVRRIVNMAALAVVQASVKRA
ncbi:MAG TPA: NADP-dependent malic enzyme [Steroidobacteraceae bacterium]|nr:NADP-dependent malic enzyme [Steroidobacteraceae bacterium]